jgi:Myb-like DNA-binding domain
VKQIRKWTPKEDEVLIKLKSEGHTWAEISKFFNKPATTCGSHYTVLMKNAVEWNPELDQKLENAYLRHRDSMWKAIGSELEIPWRAAEDRMWDLGKKKFVKK